MKFWDSSAAASLVVGDAFLIRARAIASDDPVLLVWWATEIETASALWRAVRAGRVPRSGVPRAEEQLAEMAGKWLEVPPTDEVRRAARRLLTTHALRAGDSLQLAAAIAARAQGGASLEFVCFDARLAEAARAEGFVVLDERR